MTFNEGYTVFWEQHVWLLPKTWVLFISVHRSEMFCSRKRQQLFLIGKIPPGLFPFHNSWICPRLISSLERWLKFDFKSSLLRATNISLPRLSPLTDVHSLLVPTTTYVKSRIWPKCFWSVNKKKRMLPCREDQSKAEQTSERICNPRSPIILELDTNPSNMKHGGCIICCYSYCKWSSVIGQVIGWSRWALSWQGPCFFFYIRGFSMSSPSVSRLSDCWLIQSRGRADDLMWLRLDVAEWRTVTGHPAPINRQSLHWSNWS
jgi:hypothetical protein